MNYKQTIASAKALACDNKDLLLSIIKMCNLNPVNNDYTTWGDEYGNFLDINEDGKLSIRSDSSELNTTSDLYYKAKPNTFESIKSSSTILVLGNIGEKSVAFAWFLGYDERLRCSFFIEGKWECNINPLLSGIPMLRNIAMPGIKECKLYEINNEIIENISIYKWNEDIPEKIRNAWLHFMKV